MRWEDQLQELFADLEGRAEALYDADRAGEVADRSRAEYHKVSLASRLVAGVGERLVLEVRGVGRVEGELRRIGDGWCLVAGAGPDWVVRTAAVDAVHDASPRSVPEIAWSPLHRLGLGSALRRLAEAGERCVLHRIDGAVHQGRLGRVGADFVEVVAAPDRTVLVSFAALAAVRGREQG